MVSLSNRSEFAEDAQGQVQDKSTVADQLKIDELVDWKGNKTAVRNAAQPIIILHFWASWCAPCIHEFPDLINMVKSMKGKVKVIALSEDKSSDEISAFIKSFKDAETTENFHLVWDEKHVIMNDLKVNKLPESFIYGPSRNLAKHIGGAVSWTSPDTAEYFKMLESTQSAEKK